MARTLRHYLPALLREWWALAGLASSAIGYLVSVVARLSVPVPFWVALFLCCLVVAQVRVYHKLRVTVMPDDAVVPLPQWAGFATHASADGAWLSVVIWGRPAAAGWVSTEYPRLRNLIEDQFAIPPGELSGRTYNSGADLKWPAGDFTPRFHGQVGIDGLGALVLQWRNSADGISLRWILSTLSAALGFVAGGATDGIIRPVSGRKCVLALGNWPEGGLLVEDVLSAERTDQWVRGYKLTRNYDLGRKFDPWELVLDFAGAALGDGGYVGFEQELKKLSRQMFPLQPFGGDGSDRLPEHEMADHVSERLFNDGAAR